MLTLLAGGLIGGCNAGDTPVEVVPVKSEGKPSDPTTDPIQANPNIPQAAKDAMGGGKK